MTDFEILQARMKELETENKKLRDKLGKPKRSRVAAFPPYMLDKYENLKGTLFHDLGKRVQSEFANTFSRLLRGSLFYETRRDEYRGRPGCRSFIACKDMSEEQYSVYLETVDAVFAALSKGREKALALNGAAKTSYENSESESE